VLLRRQERRYKPGGLCREGTLYTKKYLRALNGLNKKKMATQQKQDSMRLAEIHKVSFFTHKLVTTTTTALFMPRKKLEREVYRGKRKGGGRGISFINGHVGWRI